MPVIDLAGNTIKADGFTGPVTNADVSALTAVGGTLTGTTDGTLADVTDIALSTSNTYTDAAVNTAVNTAVAEINEQLKELQTAYNALLAALQA